MANVKTFFNSLLVAGSCYTILTIPPQAAPYFFTVSAFGVCHGLLGLIESLKGEVSQPSSKVMQISYSFMEMLPLPLINIQLYLASSSSNLALAHGLFVIPLGFDLIAKLFTEEGVDSATETLKDLTILGNVISLTFLAVNEKKYVYGMMAFIAFLTKYGSSFSESLYEGSGEYVMLFGTTHLIAALPTKGIAPN